MTTLEYALPVGGAIASFVGAWFSHARASAAERSERNAAESESASQRHADRAERAAKPAKAHHDCVRTVPEPAGAFRTWLAGELDNRTMTDPTPTIPVPINQE